MAKVKVINSKLNGNLNGSYFNDTPSNTIFSFGRFFVTTNFDDKTTIDYSNTLSSFVTPVNLDSLGIQDRQSEIMNLYSNNAVLNLDKTDLNTFVKFGSAYEFLRVSIQNVITRYPGSLFVDSQKQIGGNTTFTGLSYNQVENISTFYLSTGATVNKFGLIINNGNEEIPDGNELKNLNLSYEDYVVWSGLEPNKLFKVVGYTGNTAKSTANYDGTAIPKIKYIRLQVEGNPFESLGTGTTAQQDFHIRPNNEVFEEFRALLDPYERNLVSKRNGSNGFVFKLKEPTLLEDGKILYYDKEVVWVTSDQYNIDINSPSYQNFLTIVLTIGSKYDQIKTDLIARFLTPASLKNYDFTDEKKTTKLLRLYGREFDQMKEFIDSLVYINKVTYDKKNNIPDQLIQNMARTFGWDYFNLLNEGELVESFLTVDDTERDLNENELPAEVDMELWRRILMNTSYFWKSKGTRQAIKSIFLLIGIPEPFINITEYVYTVDGKINPNTVALTARDFPSNSLPYDNSGYPKAPLETNDFFFQISGDTDSGQRYLDVFRQAGFNLKQTPDNKKSWIRTGATTREHYSTSQYYQEDSRLVINTKEIDIALDTTRGIEFDVYEYIQTDFAANSSGYTLPYSYVNISNVPRTGNTFSLPTSVNNKKLGDIEVRYNGILLNAPSTGDTNGYTSGNTETVEADYTVNGNTFTIPELSTGVRASDVIQVTLIDSGTTISNAATSAITVTYIVTRVKAELSGTYVPLPSFPRGDVQLTINGIALTKGTSQFSADYIVDPANSTGGTNYLIIQNPDVITFLNANPDVQISYMEVQGSNDINLRSEVFRVDSFNSSKIYFNNSANKYVYRLNYKVNNASEVKFLIDGIALEPYLDYSVNVMSPYEIFLPRGIRYGSVISAYYLVGGQGAFDPVINDVFGLGDISELSFLEFLELIQRKMINARNRKTVTDFKGGWYPAVLAIYEKYLQRAELPNDDPLQSNGYTFQNLYSFLGKYNAFFQRFVDQLLPATIIRRRGGLLIRNTLFTKQKHWYKRGVNVANTENLNFDLRGNPVVQYLGNAGSVFQIIQGALPPPPPPPPVPPEMYVETTPGVLGSLITGGRNILNYDEVIEYGIEYRKTTTNNWIKSTLTTSLTQNSFTLTLTDLDEGATYQYRAFVESVTSGFTGNTLSATTPPPPLPTPSVETKRGGTTFVYEYPQGSGDYYGLIPSTGGDNIVRYADVQYYGMQYKKVNDVTWLLQPSTPYSGPLNNNSWSQNIGLIDTDSTYQYRAFIIVDGVTYYGISRLTTTPPEPSDTPPDVTTSLRTLVGVDGTLFTSIQNKIENGDPSTIITHGIAYTSNSARATDNLLKVGSTDVFTSSVTLTPPLPETPLNFSQTVSGLIPNTQYYFRAYARNGIGDDNIGYGDIKTVTTNVLASKFDINVEVVWTGDNSGVLHGDGFTGKLVLMQSTTQIQEYNFGLPVNDTTETVIFANRDATPTPKYSFNLTTIQIFYGGNQEVPDIRWRDITPTTPGPWQNTVLITNVDENKKSFQVQVSNSGTLELDGPPIELGRDRPSLELDGPAIE